MLDCVQRTFRDEGMGGFFRGVGLSATSRATADRGAAKESRTNACSLPTIRYSHLLSRLLSCTNLLPTYHQVTIPLITITAVRTASFSIYSGVKDRLYDDQWVRPHNSSSVVIAGFLGGAASGLLLSCGTSAFEYTKVSASGSTGTELSFVAGDWGLRRAKLRPTLETLEAHPPFFSVADQAS